jgi:uncharacterized LabA/DUF88 family protein
MLVLVDSYLEYPQSFRGIKRLMIFIDGAYLAKNLHDTFQGKEWDCDPNQLTTGLIQMTAKPMQPDLVRVYYYDAIPDDENKLEGERKKLLTNFEKLDNYQLRKGRLKDSRNPTELGKRKQKGVDILLSIDMLSKAYENHYDIAIILTGDDDFLDLVEAVKDAGKRVVGVYFEKHISEELKNAFDKVVILNEKSLLDTKIVNLKTS